MKRILPKVCYEVLEIPVGCVITHNKLLKANTFCPRICVSDLFNI